MADQDTFDLAAIKDRREACLRSDGTPNLNYNFVLYDGRALVAEVERLRDEVETLTEQLAEAALWDTRRS